jgi:hypothetical protein
MKTFLPIFLLFPFSLFAQDISGIWIGHLESAGTKLPFELAISAEGKEEFTGYSHTVFTFDGIDNIGVKTIKLKNKKGNVSMEDGELVFSNYTTPPRRVKMMSKMFLKTSDSLLVLTGSFFTRTIDFRESDKTSFTGTIYLRKQKGFPQTQLIAKLAELEMLHTLSFAPEQFKKQNEPAATASIVKSAQEPPVKKEVVVSVVEENKKETPTNKNTTATISTAPVKPAASIDKRKTEVITNVFFTSDSLVLSLYDNGTVDGDTVSVVLNGEVIIAKKGLSENAIRTTIHISPQQNDSLQLVMYAENLGSIPPNTGVLVIQDGNKRTEVRFAGDLQRSSAIILQRRR